MEHSEKLKILCVEDERAVAGYISSLIDKTKYQLDVMYDGQEALDYLLSAVSPPDIVLLDYLLPSLDGIKILQELKAHGKMYPVIFLTAVETIEIAVKAMKEGALDYLAKSAYLKTELNIKIDLAYQSYKSRLEREYFEEQLSMFKMAVDQSPNSIVITNPKSEIVYVNRKFCEVTGYNSRELIGGNPRILKAGTYPEGFYENLWNTITSGKTWRGEFVNRKKNKEIYFEKALIEPIKNKSGEIINYLGIKEDITERKKSKQALKESESRVISIFEAANAGIFFADKSGKITMANKAFQDMVEYSAEELTNMDFTQFIYEKDLHQINEMLKELILNEIEKFRIELRYITGKSKILWGDIAVTVIQSEEADSVFYVGVVKDITEQKNYQQQLEDVIASKDKFFSIISHDLRNQFSSLLGLSEIILDTKRELRDSDRERFIYLLYQSSKVSLSLLEDLLKWSRSQINQMEMNKVKIRLSHLVNDIYTIIYNQASLKKIKVVNEIEADQEIYADRQMISTVLRNLLSNAIKFTPEGGEIVLKSETSGIFDSILIKDNGVGMSPETVRKLFRIEEKRSTLGTANEMGTGLGLILCKEFITKHGGSIEVESELGKGSAFKIMLPVK